METGKFDPRLGRSDRAIYKMPTEEQVALLKEIWRKKMGTELDLEHPETFNEKLQWYKLYYRHPDMVRCADKVAFKEYAAERLGEGYTARLLRVWHSPDEVRFDGLPDRFVVKSNCQDNGRYIAIVRDRNHYDFAALEREIREYWFNPLNLLINGFCHAYHGVIPKVLVEEYIGADAEIPRDCKVFCFGGAPEFCYVTREHFQDGRVDISGYPSGFYSLSWEPLHVKYGSHKVYSDAEKPRHFEEMIAISRKLSAGFPFVRVDFFDVEAAVYLAELTFYPGGGMLPYDPPEFAAYMSDRFRLDGTIRRPPCTTEESIPGWGARTT